MRIETMARMAIDELQCGPDVMAGNLYADSLANLLIVQLLREYSSEKMPAEHGYVNGLTNRKLTHVLDLIESDLAEDLPRRVLALAAGLSEYHFLRMFKHHSRVS